MKQEIVNKYVCIGEELSKTHMNTQFFLVLLSINLTKNLSIYYIMCAIFIKKADYFQLEPLTPLVT